MKIKILSKILTSASPLEAKYIIRTVLEDLRIGVGESTIRDSILWAFFSDELNIIYPNKKDFVEDREKYNKYVQIIQNAIDISVDLSYVGKLAQSKKIELLKNVEFKIGKPLKVMLFQKASIDNAFEKVGKPCALEHKYDGFRMLISKQKDEIKIFTRRLENVTIQFPEVVEYIKQYVNATNVVIDGEAIGFDPKTKRYLPFQNISQRIKRKHNISELAKNFPVELRVFDILYLENQTLLKTKFSQRRKLLEKIIISKDKKIMISNMIITTDLEEAKKYYENALNNGYEGIMAKNLDGIYKPGSRVGYGVKIKPIMEPLDLVITKAEWGEGKRGKWLTSYTLAIQDENQDLLEIGKASSGLKEIKGETYEKLTKLLLDIKINEIDKTVTVKPDIILEIAFEEIQKSPTYSSGYALRFPRILRIRFDKDTSEITTLEEVKNFFHSQKKQS